jgi:hypothetical protein
LISMVQEYVGDGLQTLFTTAVNGVVKL